MDRTPIEVETFHHVYNRGTDKRIIFEDTEDYKRFVLYLNVVNDTDITSPAHSRIFEEEQNDAYSIDRLVDLVAFCLMPNHFHLLLHERIPGGISKFMQRLSTAYTMYFNEKNERSGALFQGRFKSKFVDSELYLLKIIDYIHLNPPNPKSHKWSSYHYYCGENNFEYLLQTEALDGFIETPRGKEYQQWLKSQKDFEEIDHLSIDGKKQK